MTLLLRFPLIIGTLDTSSTAATSSGKSSWSNQYDTRAIDRVFRLDCLLMARGSRVCCTSIDGIGPYRWQTSLSICGHVPAPVELFFSFVAFLSPQAHQSTPALASISYRPVIRRLWCGSPSVQKWFLFLDLNEVMDLGIRWLSGAGLSWRIRADQRTRSNQLMPRFFCPDRVPSWLTARVGDNSTQTPLCNLSLKIFWFKTCHPGFFLNHTLLVKSHVASTSLANVYR